MRFRIYGASDDLVVIDGGIEAEASADAVYVRVGDDKQCTVVRMEYAPSFEAGGRPVWQAGCWVATLMPIDEDVPMHQCTVMLEDIGYSAEVHFDVPDGTPVVWRRDHDAEWAVPS